MRWNWRAPGMRGGRLRLHTRLLLATGAAVLATAADGMLATMAADSIRPAPSDGSGHSTPAPPRLQWVANRAPEISESELIELMAELYARICLFQSELGARLASLSGSGSGGGGSGGGGQAWRERELEEERRRLEMELGADEESLGKWLAGRQSSGQFQSLEGAKFELLSEPPNRTINVCLDGPKILVLPNVTDVLYCYTRDQWLERLWQDLQRNCQAHLPLVLLNRLIFVMGATGNVFVCLSVYRNHQLRNVTNYFIVNLAFADLLVILICLPATQVWDLSLTWFFGTLSCKLVMFLQDVSVSVSVLTLTAISLDRYYALCQPLKFKSSLGQAKRTIGAIWLVSLLIMSPDLVYLAAHESQELREAGLETVLYSDCDYDWSPQASKVFQFIKTILLYLVPFMLMFRAHYAIMRTLRAAASAFQGACKSPATRSQDPAAAAESWQANGRSAPSDATLAMITTHTRSQLEARRKAAKMLAAIVIIFGLCYLPVHLINFLRQFIDDIPQTDATSTLAMLAHSVCYLNSAINPIIYNHMNSVFRAEFKRFLSSCFCWRRGCGRPPSQSPPPSQEAGRFRWWWRRRRPSGERNPAEGRQSRSLSHQLDGFWSKCGRQAEPATAVVAIELEPVANEA